MDISSCQRNGHWAAINHLSGCGLVQPIKELSSAAGRCAGRACALIRQLLIHWLHNSQSKTRYVCSVSHKITSMDMFSGRTQQTSSEGKFQWNMKTTKSNKHHRVAIVKITLTVLLTYFLINWAWINVDTLSNAQQINNVDSV